MRFPVRGGSGSAGIGTAWRHEQRLATCQPTGGKSVPAENYQSTIASVSNHLVSRLTDMNIHSNDDLIDALIITLSMLREVAETPEALTPDETEGILRFSKSLVAYAIKRQNEAHVEAVGR